MQDDKRITILGDGAMGMVCSQLLSAGGAEVTLWGAFAESVERLKKTRGNERRLKGAVVPGNVNITAEDACVAEASMVVCAVPTQYLRGVWGRLAGHMPRGVPIVSVSKGVELETLLRPTQVIAEVLGSHGSEAVTTAGPHGSRGAQEWPLAALSGPNIAAELAAKMPGTAVAASHNPEVARRVQQAFSTQWLRVYTNTDLIGVELAGATKNIIAIAAGIIDGLNGGNNAKAALVTRGLVEITRLGTAMGAHESTFQGLAGLGDLITTCVSPLGRNRHVGEQIGRGRKLDEILGSMDSVAEGVPTTRAVMSLAKRYNVEMPITEQMYAILFEGKDVAGALSSLMNRAAKPERVS